MNPSLPPDSSVLPRVARGDAAAMNTCIENYGPLVWSIVRRYVHESSSAEDVVQEVFTEVWRHAGRFDGNRSSERSFIGMISRRRAIDWVRRETRRPSFEEFGETHLPEAGMVDADSKASGDVEALKAAVKTLPEDTRELFALHFDQGMTHPEIAERLQVPLGTVKTKLRRGLMAVRKKMELQPEGTV